MASWLSVYRQPLLCTDSHCLYTDRHEPLKGRRKAPFSAPGKASDPSAYLLRPQGAQQGVRALQLLQSQLHPKQLCSCSCKRMLWDSSSP